MTRSGAPLALMSHGYNIESPERLEQAYHHYPPETTLDQANISGYQFVAETSSPIAINTGTELIRG